MASVSINENKFYFETSHITKSPCRDCAFEGSLPGCSKNCRTLAQVQALGRRATVFVADVTSRDQVYSAVDHAEKELGRFERFMDRDKQALTGREIEGMRTFINVGCVQCHSGPNLGGMTFQKIGVLHKYANDEDIGRFKVTNLESDKYVFKVPMLRRRRNKQAGNQKNRRASLSIASGARILT